MQMMYDIVSKELKSSGIEKPHPCDYLNFYCLGNREKCPDQSSILSAEYSTNSQVVIMLLF